MSTPKPITAQDQPQGQYCGTCKHWTRNHILSEFGKCAICVANPHMGPDSAYSVKIESDGCPEYKTHTNPHQSKMAPAENKFHVGNGSDGKHYWLTPPDVMDKLIAEFGPFFDPCPYPKPDDFDGLTAEWGCNSYVNPPFGSIMHNGKKKGPTAWARKAIAENQKGKRVVLVYPIDKWVLMLIAAGANVRNLGDVRWCATEDGSQGKGTGRHIAAFILEPQPATAPAATPDAADRAAREIHAEAWHGLTYEQMIANTAAIIRRHFAQPAAGLRGTEEERK